MVDERKITYSNKRQEVAENDDHPITEETWHIKEISLGEEHTKHTMFHFGNDFHRSRTWVRSKQAGAMFLPCSYASK